MKLNIYSEQKKLIPRKQIGGQIPKFQNSGTLNYRTILNTVFGTSKPKDQNLLLETGIPGAGVRRIARRYNSVKSQHIPNSKLEIPTMVKTQSYVGVPYASNSPGTHNPHMPYEMGDYGYTIFNEKGDYTDYPKNKSAEQTNESASKRTNVSVARTLTMTNAHLKARNNAIQRGWRDYFYNGKRYSLTGSDLKQARKNWNINKGRLPRKTQNSFNPGQVLQESVLNGNELKQEIAPIKADFGYGVNESDLKTQYPLTISDEVKNFKL